MNCSTVVATIEIIEKSHFNDMWQGNTKARGSSHVSLILVAGTNVLYANDYEMASKVAIDSEKPSLGRIQADFVAPPHSPASIKRSISRVERTPELAHADLFAGLSSDTPLKEGHIFTRLKVGGKNEQERCRIFHDT